MADLDSASKDRDAEQPSSHLFVWLFNMLFLAACLGALAKQLGQGILPGLIAGCVLILGLNYMRLNLGPMRSFKHTLSLNLGILFVCILTAMFFLWNNLLNEGGLAVAEHTVILFFLLGLSSASVLLKRILAKYSGEPPVEIRIKNFMGGPSLALSFCVAAICSCLLLLVFYILDAESSLAFLKIKFLERGIIPPICLILFFWGGMLLFGKYVLSLQNFKFGMEEDLAGAKRDLSSPTLRKLWQDYKKSTGQKADARGKFVDVMWQANETFYLFPRYINWAIPILGFIGTVLGISLAAAEIGNIVGSSSLNIGDSISSAMGPLGIAFDTTLIALSLSVVLALAYTLLQRWEEQKFIFFEEFLDKSK